MRKIATRKELKEVGNEIWGDWWQTNMARYLGKSDRTIRTWADGTQKVPYIAQLALNFALLELKK